MPYIKFNNANNEKDYSSCENCIHKINVGNGIGRCSILNKFIFDKQLLTPECIYNDVNSNKHRKCIFGIFTWDEEGNTKWTGLLSYINVVDKTDNDIVHEVNKTLDNIYEQYPKLKKSVLFYCLLAESIKDKPFKIIGNLLNDNILKHIVDDANDKFL